MVYTADGVYQHLSNALEKDVSLFLIETVRVSNKIYITHANKYMQLLLRKDIHRIISHLHSIQAQVTWWAHPQHQMGPFRKYYELFNLGSLKVFPFQWNMHLSIYALDIWCNISKCTNDILHQISILYIENMFLHRVETWTHRGRVTHIFVGNIGHRWFRYWLFSWSTQSHYLNQCQNIINWHPRSKLLCNINRNPCILINKNLFKVPFGKWRPFCLGLVAIKRSSI